MNTATPFAAMSAPMQKALTHAGAAGARGEVPVGAVVVREGKIIAGAGNETEATSDPTAHAELLALRRACEILRSPRLVDCDLYVTLEPCPMCAAAIGFARIRRLIYGACDPKGGGVDHGPRIYAHPTCHHAPEVIGGVMEMESSALLKTFFQERR